MSVHYVVVPGINNSDADHWQSRWQTSWGARATRVEVDSWDDPDRDDWVEAIDRAVASPAGGRRILVAHSLGCLAVVDWLSRCTDGRRSTVAGAFLVAPPDPTGPRFPPSAASFRRPPGGSAGVAALLVSSDDDPYCLPTVSRALATAWGATWLSVGHHGHLNSASGLGSWSVGRQLLTAFVAGAGVGPAPLLVGPVSIADADVVGLVDDLTTELAQLGYTAAQTFGYDVAQLARSGVHLVGARVEKSLVGIGGVEVQADGLAELRRFYVRPEFRGSGAATQILDALITYAQERGARRLRLETGDRQHRALAFYRRQGFRPTPRFPPYVDSDTSVCLVRDLPGEAGG